MSTIPPSIISADLGGQRKVHFQTDQVEDELPPKEFPRIFGFRTSALIEIGIFFLLMLAIDILLLSGDRFATVNPHPFFIIVILIAVQYGSSEGLLAATAATAFYLIGNMPEQKLDMDYYDYLLAVTKLPILWFISALLLGELRLRQIRERDTLREYYENAREREGFITTSFRQLEKVKNNLEVQIASQMRSGLSLYRAANKLEKLEPRDVVMGVGEFVQALTNAEKFSLSLLSGNKLEVVLSQNWEEDDLYQPVINNSSALFQAVVSKREFLSVINEDQRDILGHEGMLAGPVLNRDTGEVVGMLKIEKCHFLDINLTSIETFRMLCEWIGVTYTNARRYQEAKKESLINPSLQLLSQSFLRRQSDFLVALGKRAGFDVSMVLVRLENMEDLDRESQQQAARALGEAVRSSLRAVDQAYEYTDNQWNYAVLLPYTPQQNAHVVVEKIQKGLAKKITGKKGAKPRFAHEVRSLYRHAPRQVA